MTPDRNGSADDPGPNHVRTGTILPFRPRTSASVAQPDPTDLDTSSDSTPDDFRHRMLVNAAGLACAVILTASGIWLASSIANLRNTQDCVLSGRRDCAPIAAVDRPSTATRQH